VSPVKAKRKECDDVEEDNETVAKKQKQ
jgi:hypothetical protein